MTRRKKTAAKKMPKANAKQAAWSDPTCRAVVTLCSFDREGGKKALAAALRGCRIDRGAAIATPEVIEALAAQPLDRAWLSTVRVLRIPPQWALDKIAPGSGGEANPLVLKSFADLLMLESLEELDFLGDDDQRARDIDIGVLASHPSLRKIQVPSEPKWRRPLEDKGWVCVGTGGWTYLSKESTSPAARVAHEALEHTRKRLPTSRFKTGVGGFSVELREVKLREVKLREVKLHQAEIRATLYFSILTKSGNIGKTKEKPRKRGYSFEDESVLLLSASELAGPNAMDCWFTAGRHQSCCRSCRGRTARGAGHASPRSGSSPRGIPRSAGL
jgi:hypothetical protein